MMCLNAFNHMVLAALLFVCLQTKLLSLVQLSSVTAYTIAVVYAVICKLLLVVYV